MNDLVTEIQDQVCLLTLNRLKTHNAFDNHLLLEMQAQLEKAIDDPHVKVIILKANGKNFCAGADLAWMQSMVNFTEEENIQDAMTLARLLSTLNHSPKPTIAMVQGCAYGGGAGLIAACDMAIAASSARFCFSEIKLGLIPAVISPFVVQAIGERQAKGLFLTAEVFDAARALNLNLINHVVSDDTLLEYTLNYAKTISQYSSEAAIKCKKLTQYVANKPIDEQLSVYTATLIAQQRVSAEGQKGLKAFLNKGS